MGMNIEFDFGGKKGEDILAMMTQVGEKAERLMYQKMLKEAEIICDLARRMAPVDQGNLEDAIQVEELTGSRNANGQFARNEIAIWVNPDQAAHHGLVGDYAYLMHEYLDIGARQMLKRLGKKSQEKQAANPDVVVGGKFMQRALDARSDSVLSEVNQVVKQVF